MLVYKIVLHGFGCDSYKKEYIRERGIAKTQKRKKKDKKKKRCIRGKDRRQSHKIVQFKYNKDNEL